MDMTVLDKLSQVLLVIGGLNWGLIGFFKYNLVDKLFGVESTLSKVIYGLVGLAAVWALYGILKMMSAKKAE
jgi:uncharacterized membrane protein YuzA (DUF378 family)